MTLHSSLKLRLSALCCLSLLNYFILTSAANSQQFRPATPLEKQLQETPSAALIAETKARGNAEKGALLFHYSAAACVQCHPVDRNQDAVGPRLSELLQWHKASSPTDEYLLRALLSPAHDILESFRTTNFLTVDGSPLSGIVLSEDADSLELASANTPGKKTKVAKSEIEDRTHSQLSLMPEGLLSSLRDQADFYNLFAYVLDVSKNGPKREQELAPTPDQITALEDWRDLNHASIIQKLNVRDFDAGKAIYNGYCADCHGPDGNKPALPIARAFGKDKLKFGSDPHQMFMTISKGNGLMGRMSHLTPHQRYQVIHFIREALMKPTNPEYQSVTPEYLASLPKGKRTGQEIDMPERDYGVALGSQLGKDIVSALTVQTGDWTTSYDLHTMASGGVWQNGFLKLAGTQHYKGKGEDEALPANLPLTAFDGWQWGHEGSFATDRSPETRRGPLPSEQMTYFGYYRTKNSVLLHYSIDGREIFETVESKGANTLTRRLLIKPGSALSLSVAKWKQFPREAIEISGYHKTKEDGAYEASSGFSVTLNPDALSPTLKQIPKLQLNSSFSNDSKLDISIHGRLVWSLPASEQTHFIEANFALHDLNSLPAKFPVIVRDNRNQDFEQDFAKLQQEVSLWPEAIETIGFPGLEPDGYALDTLTVPTKTPWNSWMRTAALDFLSDGRMAVSTYGGEVWLVSGIDKELRQLKWKRFAAGLYEPLGLKVIDDTIYVTCKDRIYRLRDTNRDGEADYYENFFSDPDVSANFHAFNFDLQVDSKGNLYYSKCGHGSDAMLPGSVIRVAPDGRSYSVLSTGFRVPNGLGLLSDDRVVCSDNQGQWIPASKVNLLRDGGFYGWSPTYMDKGKWAPAGGTIDVTKFEAPTEFDRPLVWIPYELDNSSGGQLWVSDKRWGPLANQLLHTSFGKGWMYYITMQKIGGAPGEQGTIIRLPFEFQTGIMRARVNPKDGQVYATGMQGWNGGGRPGLLDHGVQRIRYTGKAWPMVTGTRALPGALEVDLNFPLAPDFTITPELLSEQNAIQITCWNYLWSKNYGSDKYSPATGKPGPQSLTPTKIVAINDGRTLRIELPELQPVDQLHLQLQIRDRDGKPWREELYWTIYELAE